MRFGYADPPYYKCCRLYAHFHPDGRCWDDAETHEKLIGRLVDEFHDGWAMSATSVSLRTILPMCPEDVRIAAWAKSFHVFKKGVRPAYSWEPVIFWRGRNPSNGHKHAPPEKGGKQTTPKDHIVEPITLKKGLTGAKPEKVCRWILDLLGYQEGDEVIDLFPGTGVMGRVVDQGVLL